MTLKGSRTEANLKSAFAVEAQANRRYLHAKRFQRALAALGA